MDNLFATIMQLVFGRHWFAWKMKSQIRHNIWIRTLDLAITEEIKGKLEWELSELDAKLKLTADKKEITKLADAKGARNQALELVENNRRMLISQIENDEKKFAFLKNFK